jgi:hypothetical protein
MQINSFYNGQQYFSSRWQPLVILKAEYYWVNVRFTSLLLKSNASYLAIGTAQQLVKQTGICSYSFTQRANKINESWDMVKNTNMLMITTIILLIKILPNT